MRKDIDIPEVKDVYIAAVKEFNDKFKTDDWNVYIVNNGNEPLEIVLIIAQGYNKTQMTSHMRHKIEVLPAKGFAKIEFIEESVFTLNNFYSVTYFLNNKMYEKRWEFPANSIKDSNVAMVPVMNKKGVLAI
ncbi:hypothetical protein GCM10011344_23200 [Dokdonia pacifica]|uniref:Uncharacterized protein n=1 Tax=Dokdonia pacifica TaxID=1627892 RepID=A0A238WKA3_9FLAO|nr:hypothetical protein [Dokdonia pacifica]GGG21768.1 hypothetical protein GCM10011344_23200 [Dokdonia pacifica]SNR46743.1 hypothetical protein SAMN06265376_1011150 [Dokdonia pacifica]